MKAKHGFDDESKTFVVRRTVAWTLIAFIACVGLFAAITALAFATNRFPTFNHLLFTYSKI